MNTSNPLVSIVIVTYNASKYILEMLESAKNQTYSNIELIISDDCSTDNTVEICAEWIKLNADGFVRTEIVTTPVNTGVSANLNRGIRASSGQWVKTIAGDDVLLEEAIKEFVNFSMGSNTAISISKLLLFGEDHEAIQETQVVYDLCCEKLLVTQQEQLKRICKELFVPGPGVFFSRCLYDEVNGFDENYPFCEEWPFFFNILNNGHHILLLDKKLVKYRVSSVSLCRTGNKKDKRVFDSVYTYFINTRRKQMIKKGMIIPAIKQSIHYYFNNMSYDENSNCYLYRFYTGLRGIIN